MGESNSMVRRRFSRRGAVAIGGIGLVSALGAASSAASTQEDSGGTVAFWLQQFRSGEIDITGNGHATLTLEGGTGYTSVVTNARPPQAGRMPTQTLIENTLANASDQFLATLALATASGDQNFLLRIGSASYDEFSDTVEYEVSFEPPEDAQSVTEKSFGAADLAIAVEDMTLLPNEEAAAMCAPAAVAPAAGSSQPSGGNGSTTSTGTTGTKSGANTSAPPSNGTGQTDTEEPAGNADAGESDEHQGDSGLPGKSEGNGASGQDGASGDGDQGGNPNQHGSDSGNEGNSGNGQGQDESGAHQTIDSNGTIQQDNGGVHQTIDSNGNINQGSDTGASQGINVPNSHNGDDADSHDDDD